MTTQMPLNKPPRTPYKLAAVGLLLVLAVITGLVFFQFRGDFTPKTKLTMLSGRAGLVMDPGTPVTFNGVQIGRVDAIDEVQRDGAPAAKLTLDVNPADVNLIPANVTADIKATTVFGNKFVSLSLPKDPSKQRITSRDVIDARSVTTEFNTVFQTVLSLTQKVDPVKLNKTLTAAAQALDGQGDRFGQALTEGNEILGNLNPRMPQIRSDVRG
ncbi:MAG: MCE family protein, partial [Actinomycetota bacterium]|nr:MCE family protein [Actinomycetota bacterium]